MKKTLFISLLCLLFFLCLVPISVRAANPEIYVSKTKVYVDEPVTWGFQLNGFPADKSWEVRWDYYDSEREDVFTYKEYSGTQWNDPYTITFSSAHSYLCIGKYGSYVCEGVIVDVIDKPFSIDSVSLSITPPVAGAKPDYYPVLPSSARYYCDNSYPNETSINDVMWFDETEEKWLNTTDSFIAGHVYLFRVDLMPRSDSEFHMSCTGTVNGKTATVQLRDSEDYTYLRLTNRFTATASTVPTISSVSFSKTKATVGQSVTITAATSTTVTKLSMYNGSTLAKSWTSGYTDSGSTRTWNVTYAFVAEGAKTLTFKGTDANGAVSAGKTVSITITAKPTISSVSFSKTKVTAGENVTITAATSTTVTKLSMYNGSMLAKSWTSGYTDSGTTRTWKVTYAFVGTGYKTLSFRGMDENGVTSGSKEASITVNAK